MPLIKNRHKSSFTKYQHFIISTCILCLLILIIPKNLLIIDFVGRVFEHFIPDKSISYKQNNSDTADKIHMLENENKQMRSLLNFVSELNAKYITAKFMLQFNGYIKSAIVAAGGNNNIKKNQIVLGPDCLLGRLIDVGKNYSQVLLVSDANSRIPVVAAKSRQKGVLVGNQKNLILQYVDKSKVEEGELLITSGDGKFYPSGLPIARINLISNNGIYASMICNIKHIEIISIIQNVD